VATQDIYKLSRFDTPDEHIKWIIWTCNNNITSSFDSQAS